MADPVVRTYGKQRMALVAPDLLDLTLHGEFTRDEFAQIVAARSELTAGQPYLLFRIRLATFERISMAVSRTLAGTLDRRPQATVFLGASFRAQVVVNMIVRSANLFAPYRARVHFAASEEEAASWLEEARRALRAETGAAGAHARD